MKSLRTIIAAALALFWITTGYPYYEDCSESYRCLQQIANAPANTTIHCAQRGTYIRKDNKVIECSVHGAPPPVWSAHR